MGEEGTEIVLGKDPGKSDTLAGDIQPARLVGEIHVASGGPPLRLAELIDEEDISMPIESSAEETLAESSGRQAEGAEVGPTLLQLPTGSDRFGKVASGSYFRRRIRAASYFACIPATTPSNSDIRSRVFCREAAALSLFLTRRCSLRHSAASSLLIGTSGS